MFSRNLLQHVESTLPFHSPYRMGDGRIDHRAGAIFHEDMTDKGYLGFFATPFPRQPCLGIR